MSDLPQQVMTWRGYKDLEHTGTWSTTRYPEDAVAYVPRARLEAVEKERDEADACNRGLVRLNDATFVRAERAEAALEAMKQDRPYIIGFNAGWEECELQLEAALAAARRDALEEAARIVDAFRVELHTSVPAVEHSDTDALTFAADRIRALIAQEQDATP